MLPSSHFKLLLRTKECGRRITHCKYPCLPSAQWGCSPHSHSASGSVPCEADVDGAFLTAESSDSSEGGPPYLIPGLPLSVYGDPHPTVRRLFGAWAYISCAVQRLLLGCRGRMNDPFPVLQAHGLHAFLMCHPTTLLLGGRVGVRPPVSGAKGWFPTPHQ